MPVAVSGSGHTRKQMNLLDALSKSASKEVLSRMQLTLHATRPTPHGASHLVQAMSVWSVKTGGAPSRHCRDARVYGHTTSAMHDISSPPPPPQKRFLVGCRSPVMRLAQHLMVLRAWCKQYVCRVGDIPTCSCLLYTSPSPRDRQKSRMPSSA